MKKILSIILVVLMLFTLISCGTKAEEKTPAAEEPAAAPAAEAAVNDPSANCDFLGVFDLGTDPNSRDPYNITFLYTDSMLLYEMMTTAYEDLIPKYNFKITPIAANGDQDAMINNIEVSATSGNCDGIIISVFPDSAVRTHEVLIESGIPYIGLFNSIKDYDGHSVHPCVMLNGVSSGAATVEWLNDNYKSIWGDIDTSKLALVSLTYSALTDLQDRSDGAMEKFKEYFPNNTIFELDVVSEGNPTTEGANALSSALLSVHPEIEYWWVACAIEQFAEGTARAAESLNMDDRVLITDVGSDVLCTDWQAGYEGCWCSCLAISNHAYAAPSICGLISMIEGTSTPATLWKQFAREGDTGTLFFTDCRMVTKSNYKDYFKELSDMLGIEPQYS